MQKVTYERVLTDFISKTMELILTGSSISGKELQEYNLVNRAFPREQVLAEATALAVKIGSMSGPVTRLAKQAILTGRSDESGK